MTIQFVICKAHYSHHKPQVTHRSHRVTGLCGIMAPCSLICVHTHIYIYIYVRTYVRTDRLHVCMYACMYVCMYCMYVCKLN